MAFASNNKTTWSNYQLKGKPDQLDMAIYQGLKTFLLAHGGLLSPDQVEAIHQQVRVAVAALLNKEIGKFAPPEKSEDDIVFERIRKEYDRATNMHGAFNSGHEGAAVIQEEVDEAWDEVKKNDNGKACEEYVQVAAMAARFVKDITPDNKRGHKPEPLLSARKEIEGLGGFGR